MADYDKKIIRAIEEYIKEVASKFSTGIVTEHSYRGILENLLKEILPNFLIINEPKRRGCGAPDYIIAKDQNIPVAFIEAKDVGDNDLDGLRDNGNKEQFDRYKKALDHILFTDYLDFHLYESETFIDSVRIADVKGGKIEFIKDSIEKFLEIIDRLASATPQKITSPEKLAKIMAAKTKILRGAVEKSLSEGTEKNGKLKRQMDTFKDTLIHSITEKDFADIYAQTICYGMFAARLYDTTQETFSRNEAAELIPKTNPFLRKIFQDIAGYNIDENIKWIVEDLVSAYRATDMQEIMTKLGKRTGFEDPLIYFYEDFLTAYDPKCKEDRGVFYTPIPVVKFIVNAVDAILKQTFKMPNGIADTSKVKVKYSNSQRTDNRTSNHKQILERECHRVQVLDPATGTGTFLAEVIRKVHQNLVGNLGVWDDYVEKSLLPRINGFELMMAPYAIAHIKLGLVLSETGYKKNYDKHLPVFLTNSLEEGDPDTQSLWAVELAEEAKYANIIKQETPVMVMIGNPPYNISSNNKKKWILEKLADYKKNLNETKQNLDDDYIKFIRLGQYYVEKNKEGIVAFITNNSFISGSTHYKMRESLMRTFDEIYILNLHGYLYEEFDGEVTDENVFNITQGVSINIFIKHKNVSKSRSRSRVYYYDLVGKQIQKYDYLQTHSVTEVPWIELCPQSPQYLFIPLNHSMFEKYSKGFKINELMKIRNTGVKTDRDTLFYDLERDVLEKRIAKLLTTENLEHEFIQKYRVTDSSSYKITKKIKQLKYDSKFIVEAQHYPFDFMHLYYDRNLISRPAFEVMKHMQNENIALTVPRQCFSKWRYVFCTNVISDHNLIASSGRLGAGDLFPLYLYPSEKEARIGEQKIPNLDKKIWGKINKVIGIETTPEQIFDYIYGILHTPSYRDKYNDFLKIDFPRIPYPENKEYFDRVVSIGNKLRRLHLMESTVISQLPGIEFNTPGNGEITKVKFEKNKVFINKTQCFENVPEIAWNFYIGGYKPAQKWLKERRGRKLGYEETEHYKKIIAILMETSKLMKELDMANNYSSPHLS